MLYRSLSVGTKHGVERVHVVTVDLQQRGVRAGLLYPGTVTGREPVATMVAEQNLVAAINGDFFDINESQHPGVPPTGATSGPVIADGVALKAAVPQGQRFGWTPPGAVDEVFGVGVDGVARTARLSLRGHILTPQGILPLRGLNQYALADGSIGAYTAAWGTASLARAVCGSNHDRGAPCSTDTRQVTVRAGVVKSGSDTITSGPVAADSVVLVGRGAGADRLRRLSPGTAVSVDWALDSTSSVPFDFAVGAQRLLDAHRPVPGLNDHDAEPRSAVGIADHGHTLRLVSTDGREGSGSGLTLRELARTLASLDCEQAVYLDGGGSATLVTREPATGLAIVRNSLDGARQRPVPNGIAIRSAPDPKPAPGPDPQPSGQPGWACRICVPADRD